MRTGEGPVFTRSADTFGRDSWVSRDGGGITSTLGFSYGNDGGLGEKVRDGVCTQSCSSRRADGRANLVTLPGGLTVNSAYDGAGFLVSRTYADPSNLGAAVSETYSWRRDGGLRKVSQTGGPQLSNSVFRVGNRVVSEKTAFGVVTGDVASVVTSLSGPGGRKDGTVAQFEGFSNMVLSVGAEYNPFGQTSALIGDGFYATFSCAAGGMVTNTLIAVGGVERLSRVVTWSASAGKPARVDYTLGGQFLRRWQYAFDAGRIIRVDRFGGDGFRTGYTYDAADQLTSAVSRSGGGGSGGQELAGLSFSYAYAPSGDALSFGPISGKNTAAAVGDLLVSRVWSPCANILGRVSETGAAVTVSIGDNTMAANVLEGLYYSRVGIGGLLIPPYASTCGVATVTATPFGGTADVSRVSVSIPAYREYPTYNPRGSILSDSRRRYRWDALERLTAVTNWGVSPAAALTFQYYPDGRRASKTVLTLTNGEWRVSRTLQYAWEGWKLAAECERDSTNGIAAVRHFVWGPDIEGQRTGSLDSDAEGVGGLLLIREWKPGRGVRVYLPISDGLGSVCGLTDASDNSLAAEFDYDPYGNPVIGRGPAMDACPFRHRTRYYDSETWLYYYGYRYYDPSVTKWISKDPLGEAGGWNLTAFCGNDPINKFDALGDKAVGNDFCGPLEWMDWITPAYSQAEVERVYAYLAKRDRHIYNPGLGNTASDRQASKTLLEKALGVPVDMAWNPTFRRVGDEIMNVGGSIGGNDARWYDVVGQTANLTGDAVWLAGGALNVAGIVADVGVAAVEKIPFVRTLEPTYQDSMRLYKNALESVRKLRKIDPDAMVYGWMHSEGAIHGCAILYNLSKDDRSLVYARTFGAGSYLFINDGVRLRHYGNKHENNRWWPKKDFVPGIAGLNFVFNRGSIVWKETVKPYVHGFDSYVKSHLVEDDPSSPFDGIAKWYFSDNARQILGH